MNQFKESILKTLKLAKICINKIAKIKNSLFLLQLNG